MKLNKFIREIKREEKRQIKIHAQERKQASPEWQKVQVQFPNRNVGNIYTPEEDVP